MTRKLFRFGVGLILIFIVPFLFGYGSQNYAKEFIAVFKENAQNGSAEIIGLVDDLTHEFESFPDYFDDIDDDTTILEALKGLGKKLLGIIKLLYTIVETPILIVITVLKYLGGFLIWYFRLFKGVK